MKYSINKIYLSLFFSCLLISCENSDTNSNNNSNGFNPKITITNKLFSFGPTLDSVNARVSAECDCCGSDFFFSEDKSFIIVSYCVQGDTYSKGTYEIKNKVILLNFTSPQVTKLYDLSEATDTTNKSESKSQYEISKASVTQLKIGMSFFKSKLLLTISEKDENEYGMENKETTPKAFLSNIKSDSIWYKMGLQ